MGTSPSKSEQESGSDESGSAEFLQGAWQEMSQKSAEKGHEARHVFDQLFSEWNNNPEVSCGDTKTFTLTTPDHHLINKVYHQLRKYVNDHPGWTLHRREATLEERRKYRVKRKSKAYFVQASYKASYQADEIAAHFSVFGDYPIDCDMEDQSLVSIRESASFSKSNNSAFSPTRFRLHDSTNASATGHEGMPTKSSQLKKSRRVLTRVGDSTPTSVGPKRSFVPLAVGSPVRRPLATPKSPKSPYERPDPSVFSSFSDEVLQAAPQTKFPGGYVYGDVVLIKGKSPQRGMVIGASQDDGSESLIPYHQSSPDGSDDDNTTTLGRVIVQAVDLKRLQVRVEDLTLVKGMPRWKAKNEPPTPDGRRHVPT